MIERPRKHNDALEAFQLEGRILAYWYRGSSNWVGSDKGPSDHFDVIVSLIESDEDIIQLESDLREAMGRDFVRVVKAG